MLLERGEKMIRTYLMNLRKQQNESQQDTATALGITRQYYTAIEAGERQKRMDITLAAMLAQHFNIPISEILKNELEY